MHEFVFLYRLPKGYENSSDDIAAWNAWLASIGEDLVEIGAPVTESGTVGGPGPDLRLTGYSRIAAKDRRSAEAIAGRCPALACGGVVEVGSLVPMPEGHGPA